MRVRRGVVYVCMYAHHSTYRGQRTTFGVLGSSLQPYDFWKPLGCS